MTARTLRKGPFAAWTSRYDRPGLAERSGGYVQPMSAVPEQRSIITHDGFRREGPHHGGLSYGEVRVSPGEMVVGTESLTNLSKAQRSLFEWVVAAAGVEPESVLAVHISESLIEVDVIDTDHLHWPVRTRRVNANELRQQASGRSSGRRSE